MGILIFAALIRLALTGDLVIGFGAVLLIGLDTLMFRKRRENLPKSK